MIRLDRLFNKECIERISESTVLVNKGALSFDRKIRINIAAMGDVGGTLLLGLRLLGGEYIESIGIYDLNEKVLRRYEREINQVHYPDGRNVPRVDIISFDDVFSCDVFVFCATRGIPSLDNRGEVRMAQFEANRPLVELYARKAADDRFNGIFAVVSDPVDPLCKAAVLAGADPARTRGYGLGVMNARARYYAEKDSRFGSYLENGRAYGPHGEDLVICNDIYNYDDSISQELTELAVKSNLVTREDGFKPYIAPAMSSAALSILETVKGGWNYSSVYTGSVFLGCRNRISGEYTEVENPVLDDSLYNRISHAADNLRKVL